MLTPKGSGVFSSAVSSRKRCSPHADNAASPTSMPVIRATTTAAAATPCRSAGVARNAAVDSGAITRPSPKPASARSVSNRGRATPPNW